MVDAVVNPSWSSTSGGISQPTRTYPHATRKPAPGCRPRAGWCASDTLELFFSGCRVPQENLLGERGRGYAQFLQILDEGRIAIAALSVGLAQGCIDESIRYAKERSAFGH